MATTHFWASGSRTAPPPAKGLETVIGYLNRVAREQNIGVALLEDQVETRGDVMVLPASVREKDAFLAAEQLQFLEDAWNNQEPRSGILLMLKVARDQA